MHKVREGRDPPQGLEKKKFFKTEACRRYKKKRMVPGAMRRRVFMTGRKRKVVGRQVTQSYAARAAKRRRITVATSSAVVRQVRNLTRMIETKEAQWTSLSNVNLPHNNTYIVQYAGGALNPLRCSTGADDPMGANTGSRIGDQITIKGLAIRGMVECSLGRSKVYFRIMLVKCPRGVTPDRASPLFKGCSSNKMIDTVNTEKFTIVWQKIFNVSTTNPAPLTAGLTGVPATGTPAGQDTRLFKAWIPGRKFGRGGTIRYEDSSSTNPKFFDYRIVILCYDWYGTPADVNNVGVLNEMYTKMYFKDA